MQKHFMRTIKTFNQSSKMKNIKPINFLKYLLLVACISNSHAQDSKQFLPGLTAFEELKNIGELAKPEIKNESITTTKNNAMISRAAGSAPPLSSVFIYAVGSNNCGWEYMASMAQTATSCNHGGSVLRIAVFELGYGNAPISWINGVQLPNSSNYQTTLICSINGKYTWPCPAGYTAVGFMRYYNLDGYQYGFFQLQNTSTNSPWNTKSAQISVQ